MPARRVHEPARGVRGRARDVQLIGAIVLLMVGALSIERTGMVDVLA
jgi:hypothetical protein